jgi:photosystem II stability/assembly factor-like uncharacterized protein
MDREDQKKPVEIFLCYAHQDEALLNVLKDHLQPLQRKGLITVWHDREIEAGSEREQESKKQLEAAQIILLLISSSFIASDTCYLEMTHAMERHASGEAHVIPIILRPVDWRSTPFGNLQALPGDARPIVTWPDQDEAFYNIAEEIRGIIGSGKAKEDRPHKAAETAQGFLYEEAPDVYEQPANGQSRENSPVAREFNEQLLQKGHTHELIEELLRPIGPSRSASSSQRSPRFPRGPRFVVLVLLALILLSGGSVSLIYRAVPGYFPWQASPELSSSISSPHTAQSSVSAPGQVWHSENLDDSGDLSGVAWSGSRFVAVGGNCTLLFFFCRGVIFTSPDGMKWTSQNLASVVWSGSRFVIVGDSGTVLTSSDGITWASQDAHITGDLSHVVWLDSRFIAVGGSCRLFSFLCSDTIFTSPDGITWTSAHTPTNQHLHSVAWSGARFVAVGDSGTIFTSPDGITWLPQSSGTTVDLLGVVWSNARFVIVGNRGTIFASSDGITWLPQHPLTTRNLAEIVWSGIRFVVVGSSGTILTSPDGSAWASQSSGTSQDLDDIVWSGTRFVIVGVSGVISTSP